MSQSQAAVKSQSQMEPARSPVTPIQTGLSQEERSFEWEISNFPVISKHESLINSQKFEFHAGESIGMASKWEAFFFVKKKEETTWAGIFVRLLEKPKPSGTTPEEHLYAQVIFAFKDQDGTMKKEFVTSVVDWYDKTVLADAGVGYGFQQVFDINAEIPSYMKPVDGCLVVHATLNLFAPAQAIQPLEVKLEEFTLKSATKARAELPIPMLESPVAPSYVKMIASDKKEFWIQKEVLSGGSPVFQVMLEADMTEGKDGVVKMQDMGSESLKLMLHYMNRGELLAEWSSTEVLVELTSAAEKYELRELLKFLDGVLGDVCTLDNVGMLIALASELSLKRAEGDLLSFLKRKGASSAESFLQVYYGILNSVYVDEEAASGASAGSSASQIEGRRPSGCSCACRCGGQGKGNTDDVDCE